MSQKYDWSPQNRKSTALSVYLLGTVDFDSAVFLQERTVRDLQTRRDTAGSLMLCEHPRVLTIGRDGRPTDLPYDRRELESMLLDVKRVQRAGPTLIHAPGQLAIYPILPLDRLDLDEDLLGRHLQESVLATCEELKITAWADEHDFGVWSRCGKVGFSGVANLDGVSCHGFFLNVFPDLELLRVVTSVKPTNRIGSLIAQCTRPIAMQKVREAVIRHLTQRLGYNDFNVFTGHPLLRRGRRNSHDLAANR